MANPLTPKTLYGIWGTLQIPYNADESIDYSCLEDSIDFILDSSVEGIYSNGTAGEFYNQTESEFDRINEMMADHCASAGRPFQIGASHMSPIISKERMQRAKRLKPAAFQLILPDWLLVGFEEQLSFLQKMAEVASPIPIVLYNPGHAKTVLHPATVKKLSGLIPELIGVKMGFGDEDWCASMKSLNASLSVFIPGHRLASGIKEGSGVGSYSNVACMNPDGAHKWYNIIKADIDEGLRFEKMILQFFEQYIIPLAKNGYSDAAIDKLLLCLGGWVATSCKIRWPYKSFDDAQVDSLRKIALKLLPSELNLINKKAISFPT